MASLVIYYSRAGENYFGGSIRRVEKGNTEIVAEKIAKITGAALFKVEQKVPYSDDYNICIEQVKKDLQGKLRPELVRYPDDTDKYDTLYVCYPNYWGDLPMAMYTVLESFSTAGKIIKPLCTHEGSGLSSTEKYIKKLCPYAEVKKGLAIKGVRQTIQKLLLKIRYNINRPDYESAYK